MEWGYLIRVLRCGELAPAQAPFLFVSGRLGSRPPVRKTNELGFGARTAGLKKGRIRPGRRKGSRPPVRKTNELGFGARTAGLKKDDGGPAAGRVRARLPAKPMNSVSERELRAGKKDDGGPAAGRAADFFSHLYQLFCVQSGKISCCAGEAVGGNHPDEK